MKKTVRLKIVALVLVCVLSLGINVSIVSAVDNTNTLVANNAVVQFVKENTNGGQTPVKWAFCGDSDNVNIKLQVVDSVENRNLPVNLYTIKQDATATIPELVSLSDLNIADYINNDVKKIVVSYPTESTNPIKAELNIGTRRTMIHKDNIPVGKEQIEYFDPKNVYAHTFIIEDYDEIYDIQWLVLSLKNLRKKIENSKNINEVKTAIKIFVEEELKAAVSTNASVKLVIDSLSAIASSKPIDVKVIKASVYSQIDILIKSLQNQTTTVPIVYAVHEILKVDLNGDGTQEELKNWISDIGIYNAKLDKTGKGSFTVNTSPVGNGIESTSTLAQLLYNASIKLGQVKDISKDVANLKTAVNNIKATLPDQAYVIVPFINKILVLNGKKVDTLLSKKDLEAILDKLPEEVQYNILFAVKNITKAIADTMEVISKNKSIKSDAFFAAVAKMPFANVPIYKFPFINSTVDLSVDSRYVEFVSFDATNPKDRAEFRVPVANSGVLPEVFFVNEHGQTITKIRKDEVNFMQVIDPSKCVNDAAPDILQYGIVSKDPAGQDLKTLFNVNWNYTIGNSEVEKKSNGIFQSKVPVDIDGKYVMAKYGEAESHPVRICDGRQISVLDGTGTILNDVNNLSSAGDSIVNIQITDSDEEYNKEWAILAIDGIVNMLDGIARKLPLYDNNFSVVIDWNKLSEMLPAVVIDPYTGDPVNLGIAAVKDLMEYMSENQGKYHDIVYALRSGLQSVDDVKAYVLEKYLTPEQIAVLQVGFDELKNNIIDSPQIATVSAVVREGIVIKEDDNIDPNTKKEVVLNAFSTDFEELKLEQVMENGSETAQFSAEVKVRTSGSGLLVSGYAEPENVKVEDAVTCLQANKENILSVIHYIGMITGMTTAMNDFSDENIEPLYVVLVNYVARLNEVLQQNGINDINMYSKDYEYFSQEVKSVVTAVVSASIKQIATAILNSIYSELKVSQVPMPNNIINVPKTGGVLVLTSVDKDDPEDIAQLVLSLKNDKTLADNPPAIAYYKYEKDSEIVIGTGKLKKDIVLPLYGEANSLQAGGTNIIEINDSNLYSDGDMVYPKSLDINETGDVKKQIEDYVINEIQTFLNILEDISENGNKSPSYIINELQDNFKFKYCPLVLGYVWEDKAITERKKDGKIQADEISNVYPMIGVPMPILSVGADKDQDGAIDLNEIDVATRLIAVPLKNNNFEEAYAALSAILEEMQSGKGDVNSIIDLLKQFNDATINMINIKLGALANGKFVSKYYALDWDDLNKGIEFFNASEWITLPDDPKQMQTDLQSLFAILSGGVSSDEYRALMNLVGKYVIMPEDKKDKVSLINQVVNCVSGIGVYTVQRSDEIAK